MPSATDRIEFLPPAPPGMLRAFGLAVLAHLFLLAALTWGVNWKRQQANPITAEAELWSSVPQQAAPKAQEPPPPPPVPEPVLPKVIAPPPPAPEAKPERQPEPQPAKVDIALEKEKEKKKQLAKEQEDARQQEKESKLQEDKTRKAAEKKAQDLAAQKKAAEDAKQAATKKAQDEAQRAATAAAASAAAAAQAEQDAKDSAEQREANLRRIAGLAGASGGGGNKAQSSGPSNGYENRIKARVNPNLTFTGARSGIAKMLLEVRMAPDGTILGRPRIIKSSGNREWDDSVVRAFEKTQTLPRDADGSIYPVLEIEWTAKE